MTTKQKSPKAKSRKKAPAKSSGPFSAATVPLSQVIVKVAEVRGIDATKAGKVTRGAMRANFPHLVDAFDYPTNGKENRDGNRWPDLPNALANIMATTGKVPTGKVTK